jgi:hypothetical protein
LVKGALIFGAHGPFPPEVIPGAHSREPGIHQAAEFAEKWIPGSMLRIAPEDH